MWVTRRLALILAAVLLVAVVAIGWTGERDSCLRQDGARDSVRLVASTAAAARRADAMKASTTPAERGKFLRLAAIYDRAVAAAPPLSCTKPLPDTR